MRWIIALVVSSMVLVASAIEPPMTIRCGREKLPVVVSSFRRSPETVQALRQLEIARLEVKLWTSFDSE